MRSPLVLFDRALDGMERMAVTRANQAAALVVDLGMCVVLAGLGATSGDAHPLASLSVFLSGLLLFSPIEYAFHRWLFHGAGHAMQRGHLRHHQDPDGIGTLPFFVPPLFLLALVALLSMMLALDHALLVSGGIASGYFVYGQCHAWIHRSRFRHPWMRRWAASHHVHHHHPDRNFGVTSPLWDLVLGTRYK
jgi:sterol desaturase/sphingolipid hydroxylase (fatty acid hydroxylase superfamily)